MTDPRPYYSAERGAILGCVEEASAGPSAGGYVRLSGDLDIASVPHFESDAIGAAQTAANVVMVDVGDLTFIDNSGLGLLADVPAIGTAHGRVVVLRGASADLHRLLLHCGMQSLFAYR
jgi:anti-anti-sigma factor